MKIDILTQILRRFTIYLQDLPSNLRLMCHSLLFFLIAIEIALTIYNHIDDENFNYIKWGKMKILKVGFIIFAINKYEWILEGVKSFFFYAAEKAIRVSFFSNEYFEQPSLLYAQGSNLASKIYYDSVSFWQISSWPLAILAFLILVGFLIITIQVIICWIEYYFLTGFSIIFLPFGALDMTGEFYRNVFKTIIGCSIKLAVMNFWLMLSTVIIKDIVKFSNAKASVDTAALIFGTLYVIVAIMQFLPSLTSGLLTASPTLNAGAAMTSAKGAALGLFTGATGAFKGVANTYRGVKETGVGAYEGVKGGAQVGGKFGAWLGSPGGATGAAIGKVVGGGIGAAIGGIGKGSYAGAKYVAFHEQHSKKPDKKTSSETSKSSKEETSKQMGSSTSIAKNSNTGSNSNVNTTASSNISKSSEKTGKDDKDGGIGLKGDKGDPGIAGINGKDAKTENTDLNPGSRNNSREMTSTSTNEGASSFTSQNNAANGNVVVGDTGNSSLKESKKEEIRNKLPDWLQQDY